MRPPSPSPSPRLLFLAFVLFSSASSSFVALAPPVAVAGYGKEYEKCGQIVKAWAEEALQEMEELPENHNKQLKELLYFLHVPRTGGRTYHQCLLRHLYPPQEHCDRSYDKFRFNSSKHCRLLVTHDDYSVLSKLPAASTSVVTNMRHPVDRIFSAYEFSVEVASRFLSRNKRKPLAAKTSGASTLHIWPWSLLVPWMREDIFAREKSREFEGIRADSEEFSNYNASDYVMPLHEFIYQPVVIDILHNGATFQVAGLTNNSYIRAAKKVRRCAIEYPDLGYLVLDVAKSRMDKMIFVGLTERHGDAAKLFAHFVGGQMLSLGQPGNASVVMPIEGDSLEQPDHPTGFTNTEVTGVHPASTTRPPDGALKTNLTVYGLIDKYENCASRLRSTQIQRRILSLKSVLPINFSSEARRQVPKEILEAITDMNNLDLELYNYAQSIFSKYFSSRNTVKKVVGSPIVHHQQETDTSRTEIPVVEMMDDGVHLSWFRSSNKAVYLMFVSVSMIIVTAGTVFRNRMRVRRFQKFQNRNVHIKM